MAEIVDGKVIETTAVDLSQYIANRKSMLDSIEQQMNMLKTRQTKIISELEGLVNYSI